MAPFLNPSLPGFLADPHPGFDELRGHGPVRDPLGWSVLSYRGCNQAFLDPALVPGIDTLLTQLGFGPLWGVPGRTLTDSEGLAHQRLRKAVAPWFTARRIAQLRQRTAALIAELLDGIDDQRLSVMDELADVVPARLFCWMVGTSDRDAEMLATWSKALLLVFTATPEMVPIVRQAKAELAEYTHALLARKAAAPGDDLASALAQAAAQQTIGADDAYFMLEELLSASVDNTANTAGLAVYSLAKHPAEWRALHDRPALIAGAMEECGRYEPAIRHTIKYATQATEIEGTAIAEGDFVTLRIAAGHRDPLVYVQPHKFDVRRVQPRPQLAFGAGRHYCLGAALGRMEVQEIVGALTRSWSGAEIGDGARLSIAGSGHVHSLPLRRAA